MQYHALALAVNGVDVDLIGEEGAPLPSRVGHARIRVHRLPARRGIGGVLGSAAALLRIGRRIPRPDVIVVQTPPAIPTLFATWIIARRCGSRLVFDWHNLGWTLVAERFGAGHLLTHVARWLEERCARLADAHLAVSDALATHLRDRCGVSPVLVFRDRPAGAFGPRDPHQAMRANLIAQAGLPPDADPAIVICPTSWTRDEALDVIIAAADALEAEWAERGPADGLVIAISGEGAGRAAFETRLRGRVSGRVRIVTTWVSGDDYPALVAAADAGLSLHRSSSGLDLPMKISDMYGAALPVCAMDYGATLRELIAPGRTAATFVTAGELAQWLDRMFRPWPARSSVWEELQSGSASAAGLRWGAGWDLEARATIMGVSS